MDDKKLLIFGARMRKPETVPQSEYGIMPLFV